MNKFGRDYQHILADDPKWRFSEREFNRVGLTQGRQPKLRANIDENNLGYPFIAGWQLVELDEVK